MDDETAIKEDDENFPTFLEDEPAAIESNIALAIKNEILSNKKKNRIIGLLGSWGSGKSSTIEAIKEGLRSQCSILEYDAWKNEKFPFKLGFLNFLFTESQSKHPKNKKLDKIEFDLKSLEQIQDKQVKHEYPLINFANLVNAIPILIYPLAFDMLKNKKDYFFYVEKFFDKTTLSEYSFFFLTFFLFGCLLLFFNDRLSNSKPKEKSNHKSTGESNKKIVKELFDSLISGFNEEKNKIKFLCDKFGRILLLAIIASISCLVPNLAWFIIMMPAMIWLIFNLQNLILKLIDTDTEFYLLSGTKPETKSIITINKTPEPNFNNFKDIYHSILKVYDGGKCSPCLIIIDNIDRIDTEEARSIWSALKGMILKKSDNCIYTNIIIPVDEEQIYEIHKNNDSVQDNKTASFIQKTFDMTFRIPPFIMDGVKDYLCEKLDKAFGKDTLSETDKTEIINIFNSRNHTINKKENEKIFYPSCYSGQPTPRKIIKLINEVVSLQKNDNFKDISIVTKFAYITHYNNINNKLQNKTIREMLPDNSITLLNIEQNELANLVALYYGVIPDQALNVAIKDDLAEKLFINSPNIDKNIGNIWNTISEIINEKAFDKPFSSLVEVLNNLDEINKASSSQSYKDLVSIILQRVSKLDSIDKYGENDADFISDAIRNSSKEYLQDILKLVFTFDNKKEKYADQETRNWLALSTRLISNFGISKSEIYSSLESYIPANLYIQAIPLLKDDEYSFYDSHILEPDKFENILEGIENEELYKHLNFIVSCPPLEQESENWYKKIDKIIPNLIALINGNYYDAILIAKKILQIGNYDNSEINAHIESTGYFNVLDGIKQNHRMLGTGFALYAYLQPSFVLANSPSRPGYMPKWINILSVESDEYVEFFTKNYIELNENNLLSIFDLPDSFNNYSSVISYAIENADVFDLKETQFFEKFNKYSAEKDKLFNKFLQKQNANDLLKKIKFDDNNIQMLYYLSGHKKIFNFIMPNAEEYLSQITEEGWKNEIRTRSLKFKIAVNINLSNKEFKQVLKQLHSLIMESGLDNFINSMLTETESLVKLDKTYNFINDMLDKNLKLISDFSLLVKHFNDSVLAWMSKTSHDNPTIFTDFVRKIEDDNWLVQNTSLVSKYISSPEEKNVFTEKWQGNTNIENAYKDIFDDVKKMQSAAEDTDK